MESSKVEPKERKNYLFWKVIFLLIEVNHPYKY